MRRLHQYGLFAAALLLLVAARGHAQDTTAMRNAPRDAMALLADTADSTLPYDSLRTTDRQGPQQERQELKVVHRQYKYRRQVGLALLMMAFIAIALTTTDAFNPD